MVYTTAGKSGAALLLAGATTLIPAFCALGSGSGAVAIGNTALISESGVRTGSTSQDISTVQQVGYIFDFNTVQMSGLALTEFGVFDTSVAVSGTMHSREGFSSITFDGTNELQIQVVYSIF